MPIQNALNQQLRSGIRFILGSDATGDIWYRAADGTVARLPIGTNGQMLSINAGIPTWTTGASPGGVAGGDLTGSYPNPTIAAAAVTYAKIQNVSATARLLGRNSAGAGTIEELDAATVRALLALGTAALANTGTASGNIPVLDVNGQLNPSVVPNIAITSIQIVADQAARLALSNVQPGDVAKQTDNGLSYILSALPASTDANWISIGDTTISAADIVSGILATARLAAGTANATTWLRGDQTWAALPYVAMPTINSPSSVTMAIDTCYRPTSASLVTFTLPATAAQNSTIRIEGNGSGGWRIAQAAGQQIQFLDLATTSGATGRIDSTNRYDCVEIRCVTANTGWQVVDALGNLDVV